MSALRAYLVMDVDSGEGEAIFAKSNLEARKWAAAEYNDGHLGGLSVRRIAWADHYASRGYIPKTQLIENEGWWFECRSSGHIITRDTADDYDCKPIDVGNDIYVDAECYLHERDLERAKAHMADRAILWMAHELKRRVPKAQPILNQGLGRYKCHCYVNGSIDSLSVQQIRMPFDWHPDAKHGPAMFSYEGDGKRPEVLVARGDLELFEEWRDSPLPLSPEHGAG